MKDNLRKFFNAIMAEDKQAFADLQASGFDINMNIIDANGYEEPALLTFAYEGNINAIRFLLARGANVNALRADGASALNAAGAAGMTDVALLLLNYGINPNTFNEYRVSPLHEFSERVGALEIGANTVVAALLASGASTSQTDNNGFTPFQVACMEGATSAVRLIMEAMQSRRENIFGSQNLLILESFRYCNPDLYNELVGIYNEEKKITSKEPEYNQLKKWHDDSDEDDDIEVYQGGYSNSSDKGIVSTTQQFNNMALEGSTSSKGNTSSDAKDSNNINEMDAVVIEYILPFCSIVIASSYLTQSLDILDYSYIGLSSLPALDLTFCFDHIAL